MEFEFRRLENGIRTVHFPTSQGQVIHLGLTIPVGSRDEKPEEQGIAHFIEHLLFKGTKKRKAYHVLNRMDSVGAELNAYTGKEETVIYASFLKEHFSRAAEVIADIAFHSVFPEKEIAKEKEVVLDELMSYRDNPSELIFDEFEEQLFPDHPMGRNILGTEKTVRRFDQNHLIRFVSSHYRSEQMVISVVGPIRTDRAVRILNKYFSERSARSSLNGVRIRPRAKVSRREMEMDTFQAHMVIGGTAFEAKHELRLATVLLNNILGGPAMNSRLNLNIREKYGIAYHIESTYHPYSDTGVFTIYLGTDKKWLERSERLILKELKELRNGKLSATALNRAKQQLKGHYALSRESGVGMMQAMGKSLLLLDDVEDSSLILQRIEAITAEEVLEAANYCFDPDNLSTLIFK
jgi:predicted Zn-dependent peptidase